MRCGSESHDQAVLLCKWNGMQFLLAHGVDSSDVAVLSYCKTITMNSPMHSHRL